MSQHDPAVAEDRQQEHEVRQVEPADGGRQACCEGGEPDPHYRQAHIDMLCELLA